MENDQAPAWLPAPDPPRSRLCLTRATTVPLRVNILPRPKYVSLWVLEGRFVEIISFSKPNIGLCFKGAPQANPMGPKKILLRPGCDLGLPARAFSPERKEFRSNPASKAMISIVSNSHFAPFLSLSLVIFLLLLLWKKEFSFFFLLSSCPLILHE